MKQFHLLMNQAGVADGGGGGTPPAAPPANTGTPPANNAPVAPTWTDGMPDELKGYIQNKGFKDPTAVLDSYRNFEKLMGVPQDRLLKLPEREDAPEWSQIQERLGKPKTADEYKFELPKEAQDPGFEKWVRDTFHAQGVSKKAAESIMKAYGEYFTDQMKSTVDADQIELTTQVNNLKKEWGNAFEQNGQIVDQVALKFGMDETQLNALKTAMGPAGAMKFLHNIGVKTGEGTFVTQGNGGGGNFGGILTPAQARDRITALKSDSDFSSRYLKGDIEAKEQMDKLHRMAYPT